MRANHDRVRSRWMPLVVMMCWLLASGVAIGQQPPSSSGRAQKVLPKLDTTSSLSYITPAEYYGSGQEAIDTLDYDYHRYNPAGRAQYPHATLGNLGSPARSLYFSMPMSKGLTMGHQAFDLYKSNFDSFRFYETNIALSRLEYSQGLSQNDAIIRVQFGRNFDKGVNLSVNYQRINQKGQYQLQRAKNTAFGIGVLYRSPKGKLDGIYHYLSNSIVYEENGGTDSLEFWLDSITLQVNIPVRLQGATATHRARDLTVQHHIHIFASPEDSIRRKADLDVIHTLKIGSGFIKFSDADLTENESRYYGTFVTDDRGIRNFIATETFENSLDFQFRYLNKESGVPAHLLRAGLQLRNIKLNHEPENSHVDELFFNASGQLGISKRISLDGDGYMGLLDASGEYKLDANARLYLFKDASTWAQLSLYQRNPTLTESRLFIDQIPVWETDFKNVSVSSLQFHYMQPSVRLRLHGAAHLVSNLIYFNAERIPQQLEQSVEVLQMSASKEIQFGPFGILGHLMLQEYDANEIALPHLIFNGQLYYTGRLFSKNLLIRTGLDFMVTDTYGGVSYFPVTGQFYFSDDFTIPQYPALDVFFSMQVQDVFMAFAKMENVTAFVSDAHFVQIADYPQFEKYFRLGLWMKLFD
ncbi:MAG TPA: putative porin [Saprospiraceae bacterium]|nr:putative porin [Saprospiraceae bacterium]